MRAIVVDEPGGPDVLTLREWADPAPGPEDVVVAVEAAGVNFIDTYQRTGRYPRELPYVAGLEGAGTVQGVGERVSDVAVGDRVAWASVPNAGYAERVAVPAAKTVPVPGGVGTDIAAAAMLQGTTAHYLVESAFVAREGQTALVHAAAGGVGLLLCQLLRAKGVRVIGTTSTREKAELARGAGAAEIVFYRDADLVAEVRELTGDAGVDVVYDGVGKSTFLAGLDLLKPRGTMVLFGASSGAPDPIDPQLLHDRGSLFLTRPTLAHYLADRDELLWRTGDVLGAVADGTLDIRIGGRYDVADTAQAHRDLEAGTTTGKLLILP